MNIDDMTIGQLKGLEKLFKKQAEVSPDLGKKVIIRTYSAGVHYGTLARKTDMEVDLVNAKRIWSWSGAATLSQLAMEGVKDPGNSKFSMAVDKITLDAIEIIPCRPAACLIIEGLEWKV